MESLITKTDKFELRDSTEYIENAFSYHPPKGNQQERYVKIRDLGKELALLILESCPAATERGIALDNLRQCIMWANASIACNE